MNIPLKDWIAIESIVAELKKAIDIAYSKSFDVFIGNKTMDHQGSMNEEAKLLLKLVQQIHELRVQSSLLMDCHPQSEWLGGDPDNPENHTLREPNCCPMPRRRFTRDEIAEAKLTNIGPCQWRKS